MGLISLTLNQRWKNVEIQRRNVVESISLLILQNELTLRCRRRYDVLLRRCLCVDHHVAATLFLKTCSCIHSYMISLIPSSCVNISPWYVHSFFLNLPKYFKILVSYATEQFVLCQLKQSYNYNQQIALYLPTPQLFCHSSYTGRSRLPKKHFRESTDVSRVLYPVVTFWWSNTSLAL